MSVLFAVVLIILAGFTLHGYIKGFVRVIFSLVSIILTIGLASWLSPYVSEVLEKTPVYENIQEKCVESIKGKVQNEVGQDVENQEPIQIAGIELPREWQEIITQKAARATDGVLEQSGIYQEIGNYVAGIIINMIACVLTFIIVLLILRILVNVLDLVAKLPVLSAMNRLGGVVAGAAEGVLIVWLMFFVITLCKSSEMCQGLLNDINQSAFLKLIYENNLIEYILLRVIL